MYWVFEMAGFGVSIVDRLVIYTRQKFKYLFPMICRYGILEFIPSCVAEMSEP